MATLFRVCAIYLFASILASCSFAPMSPRVDAASIGKHEIKLESNIAPTPSFGILYGVTDNLDVGLEVEQAGLGSTWARYSFINNPTGFSFAGNAGVFVSENDIRSNGWYAGLLVSKQVTPTVRWTGSYRHALLDYEYGLYDDLFSVDYLDFDNPDDASVNGHLDISLSLRIRPHVELAIGGGCQFLYKNKNPQQRSKRCLPIIGFSFYRL